MKPLTDLLDREQDLLEQHSMLDFEINVCDRDSDENQAFMRGVEQRLAKINKKIIKALKRELKERTGE